MNIKKENDKKMSTDIATLENALAVLYGEDAEWGTEEEKKEEVWIEMSPIRTPPPSPQTEGSEEYNPDEDGVFSDDGSEEDDEEVYRARMEDFRPLSIWEWLDTLDAEWERKTIMRKKFNPYNGKFQGWWVIAPEVIATAVAKNPWKMVALDEAIEHWYGGGMVGCISTETGVKLGFVK